MHKFIQKELQESQEVLVKFLHDDKNIEQIAKAAEIMIQSIQIGGKIISCGNGGSHCDAMHFAEELTGRYRDSRPALPAIAISDPSHISCVANDYGFDYIFSKFVEGLGKKEDALLAISTSGNSKNVIEAAKSAKKLGMQVVGLTGKNGGDLADLVDVEIRVPHYGYADRIQEIHIKVIHILIGLIEQEVIGEN